MTQVNQKNNPILRFKDSEGDSFPDWGRSSLGKVSTITTGKKDVNQGNPEGAFPFFTCAKQHTYSDTYSFDTEAILIAGNGEVGQCQRYSGKFEAYQRTYVLSNFKISSDYAFAYVSSRFSDHARAQKQMGAMPYIKLSTLSNFPIPIPHPEEQRKIASFLGAVDEKITQLDRKKTLLEDYKKGCMQQIFSQQVRFKDDGGKDFPDWEEKRLGARVSWLKDGTHGTHPDDPDGEYFLLSAKNISEGKVRVSPSDRRISHQEFDKISRSYDLTEGDILLSVVGTIGEVAIFSGEPNIAFQRSVAFLRLNQDLSEFMFQYLQSNYFRTELERRKVTSAQPGIYLGELKKISLTIPHPAEQRKIADFLSALDIKIDLTAQELAHARSFKQGLLQQMFV